MKQPKLILATPQLIPLTKLRLSAANVRHIKAGVSIEDLAADIARRGLLSNIAVRAAPDGEGKGTGTFEVIAGGRRYKALQLLVTQKRLAKDAPVPCFVRDPSSPIAAEDDSLAENVQRAPLHPLDQFRAFKSLRDQDQSEDDIAAHFFTSLTVVRQRLRLVAVSENLLQVFAEDGMSLEQLMAFTVSNDHRRQEQVWDAVKDAHWQAESHHIRRMLTEDKVDGSDRRARFVGVAAYEAAGGCIDYDLFTEKHLGYFNDVGLLDRLVAEKLNSEAQTIGREGWKWVVAHIEFPYSHTHKLRRLQGIPVELAAQQQAAMAALQADHARLEAKYQDADEIPGEDEQRLQEIEAALAVYDERELRYDPADMSMAGVFVSIDRDGGLIVNRGFVRPEDEPAKAAPPSASGQHPADPGPSSTDDSASATTPAGPPVVQRPVITIGQPQEDADGEDDGLLKPLPERLLTELTAFRTVALRDAIAANPRIAMAALLHKMCIDIFHQHAFENCLEASIHEVHFPIQPPGLEASAPARAVDARHKFWLAQLPKTDAGLWTWLDTLTDASRAELLAHCVSLGVNALYDRNDRRGPFGVQRRIAHADRLARAVALDPVAAGWQPTADNYLGRVSKARIRAAVQEAKDEATARLLEHLKKAEMAKEAQRLIAGTGWLPDPLRTPDESPDAGEADGDLDALPDFLNDDDDNAAIEHDEAPAAVAAE